MATLWRPALLSTVIGGTLAAALVVSSCGITVSGGDDTTDHGSPTPMPTYSPEPTPNLSIKVDPTILKFGTVEVSQALTLTVGFFNTGTISYHLKEIKLYSPTPFFAVADLTSDTLAPGAALQVDVTFRPAQTGSYTATMELITEEGGVPVVSLTGFGVPVATEDTPTPSPTSTPGP